MNCRICQKKAGSLFTARIFNKHDGHFSYCESCEHIFADDPTWLDEAYSDATAATDTDTATRNILTALRLSAICYFGLKNKGQGIYADVAGGYGLLTRLMRDLGFNYFWSDMYAKNLFARGFEYHANHGACEAVSAIEALEHTQNPFQFIQEALAQHKTDTFIFTTETFPQNTPPESNQWGYYSFDTGQHIAFFSPLGLSKLAHRLNMEYFPLGRIHVFSKKPLSIRRLKLVSNKFLVVPLALFALFSLGSRRGTDQTIVKKAMLGTPHA